MLDRLFKKITPDDLIEELKNKTFNESKVDSMLKNLDINYKNQNLQNFLHVIVAENRIESVKWLINNGINANEQDANGETALMIASKLGFIDSVDELIKKSTNIEILDHEGHNAIEYSILNNHFNVYKKLKPFITDINKKNKNGQTLIHLAIKSHNHLVLDDLFSDNDFDFSDNILFYKETYSKKEILNSVLSKFDDYNHIDKYERNILFYVVTNGLESADIFHQLISNGLELNHIDKYGNNILLHLVYFIIDRKNKNKDAESLKGEIKNLIDIIPVLLEKGLIYTVVNKNDETVLTLCAKNRCDDILEVLFEYDVDINIQNNNKETALNSIIIRNSEYADTIHLLLDYGANPNIKDINEKDPIEKLIETILISKENKKVKSTVKKDLDQSNDFMALLQSVLVNTDANLSTFNSHGEPYFFEALRFGNIEIVKLLIKHGADINQIDSSGENIIYKYMKENQHFKKEIQQREYHNNLQAVVMMGANVNAKDCYGGITLHKAILDCDTTVIKMLLHGGVDINAIDNRGRTILHNTIWKNDIKVFKLIYSYNKLLLNEPDKYGVLPINYAAFLGYTDLVLEIIELNGQINNPYVKTKYILNFLKKFHKNLKILIDNARTKEQKSKLNMLIQNMKKEFLVSN